MQAALVSRTPAKGRRWSTIGRKKKKTKKKKKFRKNDNK